MRKGSFISIEGLDFAGKTTIIGRLKEEFPNVVYTRAPGGNPISQELRNLALTKDVVEDSRVFMMLAAISHEYYSNIKQHLDCGKVVITDRWLDSTMAYQHEQLVLTDHNLVDSKLFKSMETDITIFLEVDNDIIKKRSENSRETDHSNVYDEINFSKINRRRDNFLRTFRRRPQRLRYVDASKDPETVYDVVKHMVQNVAGSKINSKG